MLYSSAFLPLAQQRLWWMHLQEVQVIHAHLHLYVVLEIKVALVLKYVFLTCGNFFLANPDHELSRDLEGGTIHNGWHGLTYDASATTASMSTYPSFVFTPDDSAIVIWAAG